MADSKKSLAEMNTTELGKLFPIEVVQYNKKWPNIFLEECTLLKNTLGKQIALQIEHFGSTAVVGLSAKPIIDILIEIPTLTENLKKNIVLKMQKLGYQFIWRTDTDIPYMHFVKGYTIHGFHGNIFHIHMGDKHHPLWDRIYFRDYLRQHKDVALAYQKLKLELAKKFKQDREAYTNGKFNFIQKITEKAKTDFHSKENYLALLSGGDLRSIGNADKLVSKIKNQSQFDLLFQCLFNSNRLVVMRAADAIEKITLNKPEYLSGYKQELRNLLNSATAIELKWHLALLLARIPWTTKELPEVWQVLSEWAMDTEESKIVRVNSIQSLFELQKTNQNYHIVFDNLIAQLTKNKVPSKISRIKKLGIKQ